MLGGRIVVLLLLLGVIMPLRPARAEREAPLMPARLADRLFAGGALGLTFGQITRIDLMPMGGIWVLPQWSLGVGGRYSFHSQRLRFLGGGNQVYRTHIWGLSGFTQILPIRDLSQVTPLEARGGILLHGEWERLYLDQRIVDPLGGLGQGKTWAGLYLVGVGWRQLLGRRAALNILLLWVLPQNDFSPYPNSPLLRVNFAF